MHERLKEHVEQRFGRKVAYQKDCKELSDSIFHSTRSYLSPATLRRFFGFLATNSQPSRATLDILSAYCGAAGWDTFQRVQQHSPGRGSRALAMWRVGQGKAKQVTRATAHQVGYRPPAPDAAPAVREAVAQHLGAFLEAPRAFTALVGPGGFGKSTMLAQWCGWALTQAAHAEDIIVFVHASALEAGLSRGLTPEVCLQSMLGISPPQLFDALTRGLLPPPGRFILIVDGMESIRSQGARTEKFLEALSRLLERLGAQGWFRLVLAMRTHAWGRSQQVLLKPGSWFRCAADDFNEHGANFPGLTPDEVQQALDGTVNTRHPGRLVVEEMSPQVLAALRHPLLARYFIELYNPQAPHLLADVHPILSELIRRVVYGSPLADEMLDILHLIIRAQGKGPHWEPVRGSLLRERLQVHRRSAGGYEAAYAELLSYRIIVEVAVQNRFGAVERLVEFPCPELGAIVLAQRLIEEAGGVSFGLFQRIEAEYGRSPWLPHLIGYTYQVAYREGAAEALQPFFTLSPATLQGALRLPTIPHLLRADERMRAELLPRYAQDPVARELLFEGHAEVNALALSGGYPLACYLHGRADARAGFIGNTLLALAALLALDGPRAEKQLNLIPESPIPEGIPPRIIGLWFSARCIHRALSQGEGCCAALLHTALSYHSAGRQAGGPADLDFELALCLGLCAARQHATITSRYGDLIRGLPHSPPRPELKALAIHYEYSLWRQTSVFRAERMPLIEAYLADLPCWNSVQAQIIGLSFLALFHLDRGAMARSHSLFHRALQLSAVSGYALYEVKLLKNLTSALMMIGETERARETERYALALAAKSGVPLDRV